MNIDKEQKPSTGVDGHDGPATTTADGAASEHQPEENRSSESSTQSTVSAADGAASEKTSTDTAPSDTSSKISSAIADESTIEQTQEKPASGNSTKNPAAVSLGRLGGLKGGKARAKSLTKRERSNAARKAAQARWRKKKLAK